MGTNLFLQGLPPTLANGLKLRSEYFDTGQVLYATGDRVKAIHFPSSGAISLVTELASGQMVESAMVGCDSVVGAAAALNGQEAVHKAVVQVSGSGHALDIEAARQIARDSDEFRTAIERHEQLILAQAQQSAACNAAHGLHQRMARWLLRVRDVTGNDSFPLTQEYMAEMLGVQRTSVSVVAHALQQAGLIYYRRGQLRIERPQELQQQACECYAVIKQRYDAMASAVPQIALSPMLART
jgi:CRP-like cAMP-binding protein